MELTIIPVILLNVVSSVGIIFLNKTIFKTYDWNYATCLTTLHFFVNFVGCECLIWGGYVSRRGLPWREAIPMGLAWSGSIIFANLSLMVNTTGYYQAMKLMLAPVIVVWQLVVFGVRTDPRERNALIPLILGVGLITVSDITPSLSGTVWAVLQLLSAAAVMTWVKDKQKQLGMDPTQLLHNNAFVCLVVMTPISPGIDYMLSGNWVFNEKYTSELIFVIFTSASFALSLNLTIYKIIGFKGPITLQVVGYLKTVIIFIGGSWLFSESLTLKKATGLSIAIAGLFFYSHVKKKIETPESKGYEVVELESVADTDIGIDDEEGCSTQELGEEASSKVNLDKNASDNSMAASDFEE